MTDFFTDNTPLIRADDERLGIATTVVGDVVDAASVSVGDVVDAASVSGTRMAQGKIVKRNEL